MGRENIMKEVIIFYRFKILIGVFDFDNVVFLQWFLNFFYLSVYFQLIKDTDFIKEKCIKLYVYKILYKVLRFLQGF